MSRSGVVRRGFTLVELLIVVALLGIVAGAAVGGLLGLLDRLASRGAVSEAAAALARARDEAIATRSIVAVRIDTTAGTLVLRSRERTIATHALGRAYRVTIAATRDSVAYDARGLGYGAANFTLVARRGRAADTLVVSRLGRARF